MGFFKLYSENILLYDSTENAGQENENTGGKSISL